MGRGGGGGGARGVDNLLAVISLKQVVLQSSFKCNVSIKIIHKAENSSQKKQHRKKPERLMSKCFDLNLWNEERRSCLGGEYT